MGDKIMTKKEKGRTWDGKSRPSDNNYRQRWNEIFGKKIKKDEELEGYYIDGFSGKGIQVLTKKKK